MHSVEEIDQCWLKLKVYNVCDWVENICPCTWYTNSGNISWKWHAIETLGLVGYVAWVMAILLNYFEVIFDKMCEKLKNTNKSLKGKQSQGSIVKEDKETMNFNLT